LSAKNFYLFKELFLVPIFVVDSPLFIIKSANDFIVSIDDDGKYSVDNLPVIIYNKASATDGLEFPFNLPVYGSKDSCTFS
jgi:hypothetical protein